MPGDSLLTLRRENVGRIVTEARAATADIQEVARIIVVDDAIDELELAGEILSAAGHEVLLCDGSDQALTILQQVPVELIVTDIYMPEMDGLELIRRAHRLCPNVPVLAVDGEIGLPDLFRIAETMGASGTLLKPCSKAELLDEVKRLLSSDRGDRAQAGISGLGNRQLRLASDCAGPQ